MLHLAPFIVTAAPAAGNSGFNFAGIQGLLALIGGIVVMVAGIAIANKGKKGKFKDAADSGGAVMIGVIIFAIGTSFAIASKSAGHLINFLFS
jgi:uncharacterized membrane protein